MPEGHIPGAVYTHYTRDKWRVDTKKNGRKVAGVLPPVDHLEKLIGKLGIGNDDHVVIVANGMDAAEMGTATRLYWTFLVLGHDEVSILNGGMAAWKKDKANPLETAANRPRAKTFQASFRDELIATTRRGRGRAGRRHPADRFAPGGPESRYQQERRGARLRHDPGRDQRARRLYDGGRRRADSRRQRHGKALPDEQRADRRQVD